MLDLLIDTAERLEADADLSPAAVAKRDAAIGQSLGLAGQPWPKQPAVWLKAWLQAMPGHVGDPNIKAAGQTEDGSSGLSTKVLATLWTVSMAFFVLGLVLGGGVVSSVFFYDGSQPVNLTRAVGLLVLLPFGLTALALLAVYLAKQPALKSLPPVKALGSVLSLIQIGQLWNLIRRLLPLEHRVVLDDALGRGAVAGKLHGAVAKWQVLRWSQVLVVGYQLGVVGGFIGLVGMEDRAFGWSTTLTGTQEAAERYHGFTSVVALPWAFMGAEWVPSQDLVAATGFDRYEGPDTVAIGADAAHFDPAKSKAWWRFLLLGIVLYGLLPRVLCWVLVVCAMRQSVNTVVGRLPGVDGVLRRLQLGEQRASGLHANASAASPSNANDQETHGGVSIETQPAASDDTPCMGLASGGGWPVVGLNWGAAPWGDWVKGHPGAEVVTVWPVGGAASVSADAAAIQAAAERLKALGSGQDGSDATSRCLRALVVLVRGWEPPTVELSDLLADVRQAVGDGVAVSVWALGGDKKQTMWRAWMAQRKAKDPWLRWEALALPDASKEAASEGDV